MPSGKMLVYIVALSAATTLAIKHYEAKKA